MNEQKHTPATTINREGFRLSLFTAAGFLKQFLHLDFEKNSGSCWSMTRKKKRLKLNIFKRIKKFFYFAFFQ